MTKTRNPFSVPSGKQNPPQPAKLANEMAKLDLAPKPTIEVTEPKRKPENIELIAVLGVAYAHLLAFNSKGKAAEKFTPRDHGYAFASPSDISTQAKGYHWTQLACPHSDICGPCGARLPHTDTLLVTIDAICLDNEVAENKVKDTTDGTAESTLHSTTAEDSLKAGISVYVGEYSPFNYKARLPSTLHGTPLTTQRASLLAATKALLHIFWLSKFNRLPPGEKTLIVVKTASRHVVNGITEWMPKWKTSAWKGGPPVVDAELFKALGSAVRMVERQLKCKVLFWCVGKEDVKKAEELAVEALGEEVIDWTES